MNPSVLIRQRKLRCWHGFRSPTFQILPLILRCCCLVFLCTLSHSRKCTVQQIRSNTMSSSGRGMQPFITSGIIMAFSFKASLSPGSVRNSFANIPCIMSCGKSIFNISTQIARFITARCKKLAASQSKSCLTRSAASSAAYLILSFVYSDSATCHRPFGSQTAALAKPN